MPSIIRETSRGFFQESLEDYAFARRRLLIADKIDEAMATCVCLALQYLADQSRDEKITLLVNSYGGGVSAGLTIVDAIAACPCPVTTVCLGTAASMASLIFMSGSERLMLPNSQVMIHDPLIAETNGGSALSMNALAEHLMQSRSKLASIISERTGKTLDEVLEATGKQTYFDAPSAIEWGIADRIVESFE